MNNKILDTTSQSMMLIQNQQHHNDDNHDHIIDTVLQYPIHFVQQLMKGFCIPEHDSRTPKRNDTVPQHIHVQSSLSNIGHHDRNTFILIHDDHIVFPHLENFHDDQDAQYYDMVLVSKDSVDDDEEEDYINDDDDNDVFLSECHDSNNNWIHDGHKIAADTTTTTAATTSNLDNDTTKLKDDTWYDSYNDFPNDNEYLLVETHSGTNRSIRIMKGLELFFCSVLFFYGTICIIQQLQHQQLFTITASSSPNHHNMNMIIWTRKS